jgi:hypothetical protein
MVIIRIAHYKIVKHALMLLIVKHAFRHMLLILQMFAFYAIFLGVVSAVVKMFVSNANIDIVWFRVKYVFNVTYKIVLYVLVLTFAQIVQFHFHLLQQGVNVSYVIQVYHIWKNAWNAALQILVGFVITAINYLTLWPKIKEFALNALFKIANSVPW